MASTETNTGKKADSGMGANMKTDVHAETSYAGSILGQLFLHDPQKGTAGELMAALAQSDPAELAAGWPFAAPDTARAALALMVEGLMQGTDAEDLTWEYRRLFVGPLPKAAPPWGSVYTDKDCVVFGASCLELRTWMRRNGIARDEATDTPEDHIGLMLELMAWIAGHKPELLEEYLRMHLLTWSHHFCELVAAEATHPFYRGLAQLTDATLEGLRTNLGIKVVYPHFYR